MDEAQWHQHHQAAVAEGFCPYHRTQLVPWEHTRETWLACLACQCSFISRPGSETGVGMICCVPGLPCTCPPVFWLSPPPLEVRRHD